MSPEQYAILDQLYFVESYSVLVQEVKLPESIILRELMDLIQKQYVQVMRFDEKLQEYVPTPFLERDSLSNCYFVATKEGLLKHQGL